MELVQLDVMHENEKDEINWFCVAEEYLYLGSNENVYVYDGFKFNRSFTFRSRVYENEVIYNNGRIYLASECGNCSKLMVLDSQFNILHETIVEGIYMSGEIYYYKNSIYIIGDHELYQFNTKGNLIFRSDICSNFRSALFNGKFYIHNSAINIICVYSVDGKFIKDISLNAYPRSLFECNDKLYVGDVDGHISIINIDDNVASFNVGSSSIFRINYYKYEHIEFLIIKEASDRGFTFSVLDKNIQTISKIDSIKGEPVTSFNYSNLLYIATTTGFYIYGEYYPHLRERLPPAQKLKTCDWMKLRPVIQKDLHFIFERELLK